MRYALLLLSLCLAALFVASVVSTPEPAAPEPTAYETHVAPMFETHCLDCHSGELAEAGLDLERWAHDDAPGPDALLVDEDRWLRIATHIKSGVMPPDGSDRPDPEQVDETVAWIRAALDEAVSVLPPDPGRVTIRRLNRTEYANTVRDLLGVEFDAAAWLPRDEVGYGFDHIGDVLSLPPALLEKYLRVGEHLATRAIVAIDPDHPATQRIPASRMRGGRIRGNTRALVSNGSVSAEVRFPLEGVYRFQVGAHAQQAGPDAAEMVLRVGRRKLQTFRVAALPGRPDVYTVEARVKAGTARVSAAFTNDYYQPKHADPRLRGDRNLFVGDLEVEGPMADSLGPLPESHQRIMTRMPNEDGSDLRETADAVVRPLVRRAFRRPVTDAEVGRLVDLVQLAVSEGASFEEGVQLALQAILVSPHFLFRVELDDNPTDASSVHLLNDHELACRLSYFLWSSMPDAALFAAAERGTLRPDIDTHVTRMLADPRARNLVTNFASQWLQLPRLEAASPDPKRFPAFNERMRRSMRLETELFLEEIFRADRSILELLVADFTWLDATLAAYYGLGDLVVPTPGSFGTPRDAFVRVLLPADGPRGGLLTQASILTLTSYPIRTSPVIRGKYVLEQLLVDPPPPPPPGVGVLEDQTADQQQLPLRERLAIHRRDPTCATCHTRMDALGFGLERFDAVGRFRMTDGGHAIDSSGALPDGRSFDDARALSVLLAEDDGFPRAFAVHLLTFALGRGLESLDRRAVNAILEAARADGWRFSAFVRAVIESPVFQSRRGENP